MFAGQIGSEVQIKTYFGRSTGVSMSVENQLWTGWTGTEDAVAVVCELEPSTRPPGGQHRPIISCQLIPIELDHFFGSEVGIQHDLREVSLDSGTHDAASGWNRKLER
jgi:hypothetical protein